MATDERYAAFLFYVEDWLSSTALDLMTAAEERGYLRLLLHAWKAPDCGLPNDDRVLARLSRLDGEWHTGSGAVVRSEFFEKDGRLYNARLLKERENQIAVRIARSGAGKAGAEARWNGKRMVLPIANASQTVWQNDASSSSSSNTTTKTLCSSGDERGGVEVELIPPKSERTDEVKVWFDSEFWPTYPRKVSKPQALRAARRHGKTAAVRVAIMECLRLKLPALQEQFRADGDYRPYPASWLNQTPWIDPVGAERPPGDGPRSNRTAMDEAIKLLDEDKRGYP